MDTSQYKRIGTVRYTDITRAVVYLDVGSGEKPLSFKFRGEFSDNHRDIPEHLKVYMKKDDAKLFRSEFLDNPSEETDSSYIYHVHKEDVWIDKNEEHITLG